MFAPCLQSTNGWTDLSVRLLGIAGSDGAYVRVRVCSRMWRPPDVGVLDVVRDLRFRLLLSKAALRRWEGEVREAGNLERDASEVELGHPPDTACTFRLAPGDLRGSLRATWSVESGPATSHATFTTDVTCLTHFATELGQLNARLQDRRAGP